MWQPIILIVYKLELVDRIRRLAIIGWTVSVATIIRLATEGNVAWVGSPERLSRITRIFGI